MWHDRQHQGPRGPCAQPEGGRCGYPAESDRRHRRGIRLWKIIAGARRAVCGGLPALSRGAVYLYPAQDDAGEQGTGG